MHLRYCEGKESESNYERDLSDGTPSKLSQQGGQGSGDSENYINVSAKADSVFEQIRIIAKKISRTLFFRIYKLLFFG